MSLPNSGVPSSTASPLGQHAGHYKQSPDFTATSYMPSPEPVEAWASQVPCSMPSTTSSPSSSHIEEYNGYIPTSAPPLIDGAAVSHSNMAYPPEVKYEEYEHIDNGKILPPFLPPIATSDALILIHFFFSTQTMAFPDLTPCRCRKATFRNNSGICTQCIILSRPRSEGSQEGISWELELQTSFDSSPHSPGHTSRKTRESRALQHSSTVVHSPSPRSRRRCVGCCTRHCEWLRP